MSSEIVPAQQTALYFFAWKDSRGNGPITGLDCGMRDSDIEKPKYHHRCEISILLVVLSSFCVLLVTGCGGKKRIKLPPPIPAKIGWVEKGIASWYGRPYHGRITSNGERYDMNKISAAHKRLPFNTWVRVINLDNSKSVEVRINDRGPFVKGRIIDLSRAAAKKINMIGPGTAWVRLEVIAKPEVRYGPERTIFLESAEDTCSVVSRFGVQVGAFEVVENAELLLEKMVGLKFGSNLVQIIESQPIEKMRHRVIIGRFVKSSKAKRLKGQLENLGIEGFVRKFKESPPPECQWGN